VNARSIEAQAISIGSALVVMMAMGMTPMVVLVHRGPWTPEELLVPIGCVLSGAFALAVLMRAQKLRPGESILSGRFGLVIALAALAVLLGIGAFLASALVTGDIASRDGDSLSGVAGVALGIGYLVRRIYVNLTGPKEAEDEDADP
jgi:hypothetical protein